MSNLKSESSGSSGRFMGGSYTFVQDTKRCKCDSSSLESVPDAKSWLNHRRPGKCCSYEQFSLLDADLKFLTAGYIDGNVKSSTENQLIEEYYPCLSQNDVALSSDTQLKHLYSDSKTPEDIQLQVLESKTYDKLRKIPAGKETDHFWLSSANLEDFDNSNFLDFEQPNKLCSDLDSHLIGLKQIEPWWHAADTEDLGILASQKPSQFVRNCDLPGAHKMLGMKSSGDRVNCYEKIIEGNAKESKLSRVVNCTRGNLESVKDTKSSYVADYTRGNITSKSMDKSLGELGAIECTVQGYDGKLSGDDSSTPKLDSLDTDEPVSCNLSRVELLEALCHSQTRAREAEKFAQTACDEKEHVVNLFFRQASYLFAYRQWLQMLQLETLCLQLGTKNQQNSSTPPAFLPWIRSKGIVLRKKRRGAAKKKPSKHRCHLCKYAIAFALGLGLAGAGLLVGWTIGWLFPTF